MNFVDMQKKMLRMIHSLLIKQELLRQEVLKNNQRKIKSDSVELSEENTKLIAKYFPINMNEENADKKVEVVEKKLRDDKKFVKLVV